MTTATDRALHALDAFVADYLGPAAREHLYGHRADEPVREAIRAIAVEQEKRSAIGYAVFAQRGDADAEIGFRLESVSAVFPDPGQALVAYGYCVNNKAEPGVRYLVCKLGDLT